MVTKIIPVNYTDELQNAITDNENFVGIEEMSITYTQPADTNSLSDEIQYIKLTSRTAYAVGMKDALNKEGFYIDIEIPEGHWSIDGIENLEAIVKDFEERLYKGIEHIK